MFQARVIGFGAGCVTAGAVYYRYFASPLMELHREHLDVLERVESEVAEALGEANALVRQVYGHGPRKAAPKPVEAASSVHAAGAVPAAPLAAVAVNHDPLA